MRTLLAGIAIVALAAPLCAQTTPAESVSHEMVVNAVQQLSGRFGLQGDTYSIEVRDRTVTLVRLEEGKRLLLRAGVKGKVPLQALNAYNEKQAITTRAVQTKAGVALESGFDCQLGITAKGLAKLLTRFSDELASFEAFAAKNQGGTGDVKTIDRRPTPIQIKPETDDREFVITFPTNDPNNWETAWKIEWDMESAKQANDQGFKFPKGRDSATVLFKIKRAFYKPGQKAEWIQVLEDAHPSEFYVPYYFRGTRFYDLKSVGGYVGLAAKEGGAVSQLLGKSKRVMAELRDTGPAYKHGNLTRRGEELTLWANFGAANYTYMIEYGFRDDGVIVFRHSPTGYNYFADFHASHMHGSFWRVGVKLGPEGNNEKNTVYSVKLPLDAKDQGDGGKLDVEEITRETFLDWNPQQFTLLRVTNPNYSVVPAAKDRPALPISYDLVTVQQGIARHKRFPDEKFTHHDFWITRNDCPEKMYINLGNYFFDKAGQLNPELRDLDQSNVVLWHSSSAFHVPRAEDGIVGGNNLSNGQATIFWTTFELRPRNLFVKSPIYRPTP